MECNDYLFFIHLTKIANYIKRKYDQKNYTYNNFYRFNF